jgi:hypothetical protein
MRGREEKKMLTVTGRKISLFSLQNISILISEICEHVR